MWNVNSYEMLWEKHHVDRGGDITFIVYLNIYVYIYEGSVHAANLVVLLTTYNLEYVHTHTHTHTYIHVLLRVCVCVSCCNEEPESSKIVDNLVP